MKCKNCNHPIIKMPHKTKTGHITQYRHSNVKMNPSCTGYYNVFTNLCQHCWCKKPEPIKEDNIFRGNS